VRTTLKKALDAGAAANSSRSRGEAFEIDSRNAVDPGVRIPLQEPSRRTAMKSILCTAIVSTVLVTTLYTQDAEEKSQPRNPAQAAAQTNRLSSKPDSADTQELRADLQRLKILLNQMRTNLAFVQTTQTPLKHQFELETDAWQIIVEQMERRVKHMEDHGSQAEAGR
jgi:hypothetical protein